MVEQRNVRGAAGEKFLAANAFRSYFAAGLQYKILLRQWCEARQGRSAVVYEGRTHRWQVFDSTARQWTESDTFWSWKTNKRVTEALLLMPVGSKWEIYIPQELAYGAEVQAGDIAPILRHIHS